MDDGQVIEYEKAVKLQHRKRPFIPPINGGKYQEGYVALRTLKGSTLYKRDYMKSFCEMYR